MEALIIRGGNPLYGDVPVYGAKNSILPLLAASLLVKGESTFENCPKLSDVDTSVDILRLLGARVEINERTITVCADEVESKEIPCDWMSKMRGSILFFGAMLSRFDEGKSCRPGGCPLGERPVDLHLFVMEQMGFSVIGCEEDFCCKRAEKKDKKRKFRLRIPSVGATENAILLAVLTPGETKIENAAREPEIGDLIAFLNKAGAKISGAGSKTLKIEGVSSLKGVRHRVIPDRIAAGTYLLAAGTAGGSVTVKGIDESLLRAAMPPLREAGFLVETFPAEIKLTRKSRPLPFSKLSTSPYPGFPTDLLPQFMAVAAYAHGTTLFVDNVFENRFSHVPDLEQGGAEIDVAGNVALVYGKEKLFGMHAKAKDLRAGAALLLAALGAEGETVLTGVGHIDRGYERIEEIFCTLGGDVKRQKEE